MEVSPSRNFSHAKLLLPSSSFSSGIISSSSSSSSSLSSSSTASSAFSSATPDLSSSPLVLGAVLASTCNTEFLSRALSNLTEWDTASALSPTGDIVVASFLILAEVAAVTLNLLVLIVSLKNRKLLNHADAFIVSLAASDLGHPLLGYPMVIASSFHHRWIFGYTWCQVNGFLGFLFGTNSMMTLACMSFSRLLSVTRPSTARHRGKCLTFTFLIFAILYAIFWSTCPLLGWGRYDLEPYRTSCTLQWDFPDSSFVTASFIGCLAVPAGVMCVSYGQITALAWQTGKNQRRWNQRKSDKTLNKQELRLLKMTVAMCTVFIVVWTPYAISAMIKSYSRTVHIPIPLTAVPAMAAKCSHVIDPILYFTLNKRFRRFLPGLNKKECTIETGITLQVNNPLRGKEITKVTSLFHETNFEKSKSPKLCDAVNLKCLQRNETEDFSFQIRISAEESFMLNN